MASSFSVASVQQKKNSSEGFSNFVSWLADVLLFFFTKKSSQSGFKRVHSVSLFDEQTIKFLRVLDRFGKLNFKKKFKH
jgi:hypothetical protein